MRAQARPEGRPASAALLRLCLQVGLEGIVSKRLGSRYRSGRSSDWLKLKNPATPAVKREEEEEEEDWGIKGGDDLTGGALMHNSM